MRPVDPPGRYPLAVVNLTTCTIAMQIPDLDFLASLGLPTRIAHDRALLVCSSPTPL